ncbi:hypothetical protein AK88_01208 [Plasmodium fragile]|uniref:Uncharacterized protein n=1 Tax=Plasmodium fragile TaxID=5857 RepID=A0A0D9QQS9_PLAFR|nr:uncharacterized protein AK88_01208 [Plasmodium fragile]KJP89122.1 hypothetical protein AK88_01208 [Plasmodium fragile]
MLNNKNRHMNIKDTFPPLKRTQLSYTPLLFSKILMQLFRYQLSPKSYGDKYVLYKIVMLITGRIVRCAEKFMGKILNEIIYYNYEKYNIQIIANATTRNINYINVIFAYLQILRNVLFRKYKISMKNGELKKKIYKDKFVTCEFPYIITFLKRSIIKFFYEYIRNEKAKDKNNHRHNLNPILNTQKMKILSSQRLTCFRCLFDAIKTRIRVSNFLRRLY